MKTSFLFLTCANNKEAGEIVRALLEKRLLSEAPEGRLIVCAKSLPVSSAFLWKGKIQAAKEILLMMESVEKNFSKIEKEVKKLHRYETPVLFLLPITKTTKATKLWIKNELSGY